jgi:hypothetical protein
MEGERLFWRRARWRLRGAWQWPAFVVLTLADGAMLAFLPFYGDGAGGFVPGVLLAGFANLLAVAVAAPLLGRRLRRRRPDLPVVVASDYAGTALLVLISAGLLAGGLAHRPAAADAERDRRAALASLHDYVLARAPEQRSRLAAADAIRLEPELYRACVPDADPARALCLFVSTAQSPPGITLDPDRSPNEILHGPR